MAPGTCISGFRDTTPNAGLSGHFGIVAVGIDYVVDPSFLIGAFVQYDVTRQSAGDSASVLRGSGWMAGPYTTLRLTDNLYWQARAGWGRSGNTVDQAATGGSDKFGGGRWLVSSTLAGRWSDGPWLLQPAVSISYIEETADSHAASDGSTVAAVTSRLGEAKAGPEVSYRYQAATGLQLEPRAALQVVWDFAADVKSGGAQVIDGSAPAGVRGRSEIGMRAQTASGIALDLSASYDGIGSASYSAVSGRSELRLPLN